MNKENLNYIIIASILGLSILSSSLIFSSRIYFKKDDRTISVTGSAKQKVISDTVKWRGEISTQVTRENINFGYETMKKYEKIVREYLINHGIKDEELIIFPVFVEPDYSSYGDSPSTPKKYNLRQMVEVNSTNIYKITEISKNITEITKKDVFFSNVSLEYYYSKLPQLRIELLPLAIEDAKKRAETIAKASGRKIGSIKSVSMGVVQVLSPNSIDVSDYGTYDTQTIEKEVMITVKAVFELR